MIELSNYYRATNAAYNILAELDGISLPIDIFYVLRQFKNKIKIVKYSDAAKRFGLSLNEFIESTESEHGFIMRINDKAIIQ